MYLIFVCLFVCLQRSAKMNYDNLRWRVESKSEQHNDETCCGCWIWTGGLRSDGRYGVLWVAGRSVNAHRASYMAAKKCNDLPHDISHLCHNNMCVNPRHLVHEEHSVNVERQYCRQIGHCTVTVHTSSDKKCIFKKCYMKSGENSSLSGLCG